MSAPQTAIIIFADGYEVMRRTVGPGIYTFGRLSVCDFPIKAELVSRQHATLTVNEDHSLLLEDLDSANGTFLDGQRVTTPTIVAPNQTIQIGATHILVQLPPSDAVQNEEIAAPCADKPQDIALAPRYQVGVEIAKGGMGAVLSAKQPAIRREVAMKVMLRDESPQDRLRFIEEAQITGQLEHPNIVPVYDLAINDEGQPFYTMKLVKGATLKRILGQIKEGDVETISQYPLAGLLTIFQKVCDAVAFAHAKGVIHRDLKPANIMVGEYGEVLVMDWGLAKAIGHRSEEGSSESVSAQPQAPHPRSALLEKRDVFSTYDGAILGTPQYMSPEQARGEVHSLDSRSDVFALGAILYELVTLLQPFTGKTSAELIEKIKNVDFTVPSVRLRLENGPPPPHLLRGLVPQSLEAIILKTLGKNRSQRYASVKKLQADLTAYQSGFATTAEQAGPWKHFKLLVNRHKALSLAVVLSLVAAVGTTGAVWEFRRASRHERSAVRLQKLVDDETLLARDYQKKLIEIEHGLADSKNVDQANVSRLVDEAVAIARERDHKSQEIDQLAKLSTPVPVTSVSDNARVKRPPPRVLMIGDSLSVGPFGEYVAEYLIVRCGRANFEQFASCGSSPENWLRSEPDFITKCGFRENTPERQMVIDYQDGKRPPPVKTPKLEDLIALYRPTTVVLQLGTNWMDPLKANKPGAVDKLSDILDRFAVALHTYTVRQVIWISPPDASAYSTEVKRTVDALIRNASKKYNYQIVDSSRLTHYIPGETGGDGVNYNKDGARFWAEEVTRELDRKLK